MSRHPFCCSVERHISRTHGQLEDCYPAREGDLEDFSSGWLNMAIPGGHVERLRGMQIHTRDNELNCFETRYRVARRQDNEK